MFRKSSNTSEDYYKYQGRCIDNSKDLANNINCHINSIKVESADKPDTLAAGSHDKKPSASKDVGNDTLLQLLKAAQEATEKVEASQNG
ncbi:hypothetical protein PG996_003014 [Apiospora saccharicola]|uniref:Uncharacterized protein n=1 Tax=Apiospora saccharicola TaxID=335842 RepID=A0ABR1W017_9PEZI